MEDFLINCFTFSNTKTNLMVKCSSWKGFWCRLAPDVVLACRCWCQNQQLPPPRHPPPPPQLPGTPASVPTLQHNQRWSRTLRLYCSLQQLAFSHNMGQNSEEPQAHPTTQTQIYVTRILTSHRKMVSEKNYMLVLQNITFCQNICR